MDPNLLTALTGLAVGSAVAIGILFKAMTSVYGGMIDRLQKRDDGQQTEIDVLKKQQQQCEEQQKATDAKFRSLADNCPVTDHSCPLRQIYR